MMDIPKQDTTKKHRNKLKQIVNDGQAFQNQYQKSNNLLYYLIIKNMSIIKYISSIKQIYIKLKY